MLLQELVKICSNNHGNDKTRQGDMIIDTKKNMSKKFVLSLCIKSDFCSVALMVVCVTSCGIFLS